MIWGAISTQGTAGLFFLDPGTTMNGKKYLELMKEKLELHMAVHNCEIFMHDGAPCHQAETVTNFLKMKNILHAVLGSLVRLYKPHALDLTIANTWIRPSS